MVFKNDNINVEYFDWMYDLICGIRYSEDVSYTRLLMYLHNTEFVYSIPMDSNRAEDGIDLRYRFYIGRGYEPNSTYLDGPCSVLEMMVALAIRIEQSYMDNPNMGDRTGQWFWCMISNLGLGWMFDSRFDEEYVEDVITRFLNRDYEPDGKGGLFRVVDCDWDLRDMEIWNQLCWYLDSIT